MFFVLILKKDKVLNKKGEKVKKEKEVLV